MSIFPLILGPMFYLIFYSHPEIYVDESSQFRGFPQEDKTYSELLTPGEAAVWSYGVLWPSELQLYKTRSVFPSCTLNKKIIADCPQLPIKLVQTVEYLFNFEEEFSIKWIGIKEQPKNFVLWWQHMAAVGISQGAVAIPSSCRGSILRIFCFVLNFGN